MAKPLPSGADIRFVKALRTGTVHLVVLPPDEGPNVEPAECIPMDGSGRALAGLLGTPTVTRCGQPTFPHNPSANARHAMTYRFRDEQLCVACYRTLARADQSRAFEHETPDGDEDDESEAAA